MTELIIQYVLIVLMVLGIAYFIYFLREKGVIRDDDYYGITYTILAQLENHEATKENVKKILRQVAAVVKFVEETYGGDSDKLKEDRAIAMAREAIREVDIGSDLGDNALRYLVRLACALEMKTKDE
ncbi:hypothetical protein [Clostridium thermarum]|uniref:hypothetical protein n=1 Tax=Clostridium thermarum TaxID=1716543 RepID=UPI001123D9B0|nr:hypothetical protein [Clostridium thermarum]